MPNDDPTRRAPAPRLEPEAESIARVFARLRGDPLIEALMTAAAGALIERRLRAKPRSDPSATGSRLAWTPPGKTNKKVGA